MARRRRRKRVVRSRRRPTYKAKPRRRSKSNAGFGLKALGKSALKSGLEGAGRGLIGTGAMSLGANKLLAMLPSQLQPYSGNILIAGTAFAAGKLFPKARKIARDYIEHEAYLAGIKAGGSVAGLATGGAASTPQTVYS